MNQSVPTTQAPAAASTGQGALWWRRVFLISKVNRLISVRTVSPEFRLTRSVRLTLAAAGLLLAVLVGLCIGFLASVGPALLSLFGPLEGTLPALLNGAELLFLTHHLLSISGYSARDARAPADAAILAHAGCTRGQIITARILLPIALETTLMVAALTLCGGLALYRWGLPAHPVLPPLLLALALAVYGALARAAAVCLLAGGSLEAVETAATGKSCLPARRGSLSPTLLRTACWCLLTFGLGSLCAAILLPAFLGTGTLETALRALLAFLISAESSTLLAGLAVFCLLFAASTLPWLGRFPWNSIPVDSSPASQPKPLPLPRNAWGRLLALPLTACRDHPDSAAGEFLLSTRVAFLLASFGLGTLLATPVEPLLPQQAAWGMAAGGPLLAAGAAHGVCSVNASRPLLPQLAASRLGERGTASALACSTLLLCALLGAAPLPLILFVSDLPPGSVLTAWLLGTFTVPGAMLWADCLFPARPPAQANGRIRQHPVASLLAAGLTLSLGTVAYSALAAGIPAPAIIIACAATTLLLTVTARLPRGVF